MFDPHHCPLEASWNPCSGDVDLTWARHHCKGWQRKVWHLMEPRLSRLAIVNHARMDWSDMTVVRGGLLRTRRRGALERC